MMHPRLEHDIIDGGHDMDATSRLYTEEMLGFLKYSSGLGRERLIASSNILMVVISFCFIAEATLFAGDFWLDQFSRTHSPLVIVLLTLANVLLLFGLFLAMKAPGRMVALAPLVEECITSQSNALGIRNELVARQCAMTSAMMACVRLARNHVNVAQNCTFGATFDILLCFGLVAVSSYLQHDAQEAICIVVLVLNLIGVCLALNRIQLRANDGEKTTSLDSSVELAKTYMARYAERLEQFGSAENSMD